MTTTSQTPPPRQIREELLGNVRNDLLGPALGPDEELFGPGSNPTVRYLVGMLAPRGSRINPAELAESETQERQSNEEDSSEPTAPSTESLLPSSIGLTFAIDLSVSTINVRAEWGSYERTKSEDQQTPTGRPRTVWKRIQHYGEHQLDLSVGTIDPFAIEVDTEDVVVQGRIDQIGDVYLVTIFLVNNQVEPDQSRDSAWVFQPKITATAVDGRSVFRQRPRLDLETDGSLFNAGEEDVMEMLHREFVEFAVGHGVSVTWDVDETDTTRARSVETRILPLYELPKTESPGPDDGGFYADLQLDMKDLSEVDGGSLADEIAPLVDGYDRWIQEKKLFIDSDPPELANHRQAAATVHSDWLENARRMREGLELLRTDSNAQIAFRIANRAMWQQRIHGLYARERRRGETVTVDDYDEPKNRVWYPFQLAFILKCLPGLTLLDHDDRTNRDEARADLLWFPTGGGKTEAYLGLAAYTMALRRIQGIVNGRDGGFGVAAIMRYSLRLLTIQQFQRAATLVCAMEVIRRELESSGNRMLGEEPFRIGLWVGSGATPNTIAAASASLNEADSSSLWQSSRSTGSLRQLTNCPWCGSEIQAPRDFRVDTARAKVITSCSDPLGRCEFSPANSGGEGLPISVVDDEIYRLLPSLLVGTVDKFASMPWRGQIQKLFGRVDRRCERHGFISGAEEHRTTHSRRGDLDRVVVENVDPLRPPDLIIQDELHLISGPLGSVVGIYETAVDRLCEWEVGGRKVRPKVIASTATTRNAARQVQSLFTRRLDVFPPSGLELRDNFFSVRRDPSDEAPGRLYFGISAPGRDRPTVMIRVYTAMLAAAQGIYERYGSAADPWMTLVGYFNALKELGGMSRLVDDDVQTRLFRIEMAEFERPGLKQRTSINLDELTSRRTSTFIPTILDRLEVGFDPGRDPNDQRPLDALLATNMVSVGVDVQRLGLMVVGGQPKNVAEYIQATSRVGRSSSGPGLVCTVLNWARPRDMSHYETFENFHATFYQHVEALSVTPFAARSVDRAAAGVLTSMVRLEESRLAHNGGASRFDPDDPIAISARSELSDRAGRVTESTQAASAVDSTVLGKLDHWRQQRDEPNRTLGYQDANDGRTIGLLKAAGNGPWEQYTALWSMREVEPTVNLLLTDSSPTAGPEWRAPRGDDEDGDEE